ncbi:unnamed protein product [Brassicogethes aeneus]|uniref:C2H2-type domain-containing protein n=1 Tax=Brassicogethes aeneus TaxID=1431903 RepID=A0A9P0B4H1_BRAAE|nr:unnamed protein product [Brassicogethes aeneus]
MFDISHIKHQAEWKCSKIFRPWDCSENSQESKTSTNSSHQASEEYKIKNETTKQEENSKCSDIQQISAQQISDQQISSDKIGLQVHPSSIPDLNIPFSIHSDHYTSNIAQYLGLSQGDSLFLESLSNGYALEEYARIVNQEHQSKIIQSRKQRPKKYKCPHCDVGFSNNGQLKGHIRIHTGERPFKCEEENCGKTFTRNEELTRHKRIHSGLRPFSCTQCGKRFGRKDHLKKHLKTHYPTRGMYAVPVMLPYEAWSTSNFPYMNLMY